MMGKYFGTDGFRGEAGKELTADHAYKIGRFLGYHFKTTYGDRPRIAIGKDTRRSSYMFEYALASGLTASGADAYLLHVTTTPSVSHVVRTDGLDCGIMVSASHNPFYDNGIKLINRYGEKMEDSLIDKIEEYMDSPSSDLPFAQGKDIGCSVDYVAGRNRYIAYLISLGIYSFKGLRIGLDCANGSAWHIAKSVFDALGATTFVINARPDGININENAGSTHIENLQQFVIDNNLDVGFAFDGDADRCLCVDEKGNVITGDHILYICGLYMQDQGELFENTVVTTIMSNLGLYKAFDKAGIAYAKTKVGDKYVYDYMMKNGCRLGGEQSGHIIFTKYANTGDGILTSLKVMEVMMARKKSLSQLTEGLTIYPQKLVNVRVADKTAVVTDPDVKRAVAEITDQLGDSGRVLLRESGTEPVIRVMAEASTEEICNNVVEKLVKVIKDKHTV